MPTRTYLGLSPPRRLLVRSLSVAVALLDDLYRGRRKGSHGHNERVRRLELRNTRSYRGLIRWCWSFLPVRLASASSPLAEARL